MISAISDKVKSGKRMSDHDALWLFKHANLLDLGRLANEANLKKNGRAVFYNINRHINPTNICSLSCKFCAYSKKIGEEGGYAYEIDEMISKAGEAVAQGATELHMVGGLHPRWNFQRYVDMVAAIHKAFPSVHIKAFTAVELDWIARKARKTIPEVMIELRAAGLGSFPGGGAEIFHPDVRDQICDTKVSGEQWIDTHRTAHKLGLRSNCTMLYGHIESFEHRVDHMRRLRELQDETHGFNVFIPLAFQPFQNEMGIDRYTFGADDLRTIAVARLYLDNFKHIKSYWVMLGQDIAQLALQFGANDLDGTVLEEKISRAAGGRAGMIMTRNNLESLIRRSDRVPVERTTLYEPVVESDRIHLEPVNAELSTTETSQILRSINQPIEISPEELWKIATLTTLHDLGSEIKLRDTPGTPNFPISEAILIKLLDNQSLESFTSELRQQMSSHELNSSAREFAPTPIYLDCSEIVRGETLTNILGAICNIAPGSPVIIHGIAWIHSYIKANKMTLDELFSSMRSYGVHLIEESSRDSDGLITNEKWKLFEAAQNAGVAVVPSITLRALSGSADWSSWADDVADLRARLTKNHLVSAISLRCPTDSLIMPSEYMKAIALTRLALPNHCSVWTPTTGLPTLSPHKGIGASQDQHPLMKLVSVLPGFGSNSLGFIPVNQLSLKRICEDISASGANPTFRASSRDGWPAANQSLNTPKNLRHIPEAWAEV